jgi:hypothetical protein
MARVHTVYKGEDRKGRIVYIGTTIQNPLDRFRWHRYNGKPFNFTVLAQFQTAEEMLDEEFRLIQLHKPQHNKITKRKQNFNVKLTPEQLSARAGDSEWCQCCLKRRTSAGFTNCYYCQKEPKQ